MAKPDKTKIALIQMRCAAEPETNFARAVEFIRDAAKKDAQIVCLPELFRSQYFCQTEDHKNFELAEAVPGRSTSALGDVARETGRVIVASLYEKRTAGVYHNTAVIINPDGKIAYEGAIDSKATPNPADIPSSTNYVKAALDQSLAGKSVSTPQTKPYGCSVKYKSS